MCIIGFQDENTETSMIRLRNSSAKSFATFLATLLFLALSGIVAEEPLNISSRLELFVDDYIIDVISGDANSNCTVQNPGKSCWSRTSLGRVTHRLTTRFFVTAKSFECIIAAPIGMRLRVNLVTVK